MKNALDYFFKKAKHEGWEDGGSFIGHDITDGFAGFIYFSEEHFVECDITIEDVKIYDSYLDATHEYMFNAFAEYVQQEMKESILESRDREETQYYLNKTAHW